MSKEYSIIRLYSQSILRAAACLVALFIFTTAASAATYTVDTTADNAALTACTAAANDCSLRGAISSANATLASDLITFALPPGINIITLTSQLGVSSAATSGALTITYPTAAGILQIFGNNLTRVFFVSTGANLTLDGVTVSNGFADSGGGGIYNSGVLSLTNSIVSNNTVGTRFIEGLGGGIYNDGTLTLNNTMVSGNATTSDNGGGIYNNLSGTLTLTNSTVSGNRAAASGGGIFNNSTGITTLTNSTVSGNRAQFFGGGIYTNNSRTTTLTNSTVSGNTASQGAGFYNGGTTTLTNSTVSGNSATNGGGFYNDGTLNFTSVTVAYNIANNGGNAGGGVYNNGGTANLSNTIVANNAGGFSPDDFRGAISSTSSYNIIGISTGMTGIMNGSNGNQVGINPILDSTLALNGGTTMTHALLFGSPALDKGNAAGTDQRGFLRPVDLANYTNAANGADIGAFEAQTAPAGPTAASVSISGRVTTASGRGIRNVMITLTDSQGNERTATSTAFGYYQFHDVMAGETVTLSVKARRFKFNQSSIVRTTNDSVADADFISEQ